MFQALFWKKSRFAHFGQKLSKIGHFWPKCPKMEVFRIFLGIPSLLFSETLQLIRAFNSERNVPKLAICLDVCNSLFKGWKSLKNLKVGVFESDFKQVPFAFRQTTCKYSESWGPVENFLTHSPPPGGEKMTQKPKFVSKIFFPSFWLKNLVSLLKIDFD